jgi:hypothetical protein
MNILEFRYFEPNLKRQLKQGLHNQIKIEREDSQLSKSDSSHAEVEANLGKREEAKFVQELMGEFKNIDSIKAFISQKRKKDEDEELHYMREYRIKTELWKKFMVRRNPAKVSFVVHNIDYIADR